MRIRTQLVALVSGVALPLFLLAGFLTWQLWHNQRHAYQQQFLERASAVRLALDTEFEVTQRSLRTIGDASEIPAAEVAQVLPRRFRRLLDNNPVWDVVVLTDTSGTVVLRHDRPDVPATPPLDPRQVLQALASGGLVSDLVTTADGRRLVYIAAAIPADRGMQGVLYVGIRHTQWLQLLRSYPVSAQGTLTLLDGNATVVSRTMDDARWAGSQAPPAFWARVSDQDIGAFKTPSLDGRPYYVAFSHSERSAWVLATGVPESEVEHALYRNTAAVLLVAALALLGALVVAWRLGKDIHASLRGLLRSAQALADSEAAAPQPLPIQEAETVRHAMADAQAQLLAREASLNASLEREAAARQQAESGNRAKDQFLAMMGHELRNPLSAITAAADALDTGTSPQALRSSRDIVRRQAGHLAAMVNDLMDVAQLESGEIVLHRQPLDLAQVVARVLARFQETGRCTHLQMQTRHAPAWILADAARTELIVTCLLDNACKYTPPGGTVTLEVLADGDTSVLRVRDTGIGITAQLKEHLFDAFAQGRRGIERAEGGLGLGLALVHRLVHLHGGSITAASEGPGCGAVFSVVFPAGAPSPAPVPVPAPSPAAAQPPAAPPRATVLTVVEDADDTREMMVLILEAEGRRVNAAADGPSGVQAILEGPSDAALVDIGLPGFDGCEVARRVRQSPRGADVLLVALTGFGTESDRTRALEAGFDIFLVKPFDPDRFEALLTLGLAERRNAGSQV